MALIYANMQVSKTARLSRCVNFRKKRICLFLDADGVLWEDQGPGTILKFPEISLRAREMIKLFSAQNEYLIIVVTNQTSAARNLIGLDDLQKLLLDFFSSLQSLIKIDAVYACFHHPKAQNSELRINCICRKPSPEMIFQAADKFNIDLTRSLFVGDRITDIKSANLAGVGQSFLLVNSKMYENNVHRNSLMNGESSSSIFVPIADLTEVYQYVLHKNKPWRKSK
jgi:D-glycero-D-manno-heptose 1,7-bisphosphate phosphatase